MRRHTRTAKRRWECEGQEKRESLQQLSPINFHFHSGNDHQKQEMCQPFVRYPHGAKLNAPELLKRCQHARASGLTRAEKTNTLAGYSFILSRSKILQFRTKTRLLKEGN